MDVKVRFRFNKTTGEVEIFEVTDTALRQTRSDAEHNRQHDRLAAEIGSIIERNPRIREVVTGEETPSLHSTPIQAEETDSSSQRQGERA
jgi:hypothetical protein